MGTRIAIFDIGSNSIKFLVAEISPACKEGERPGLEVLWERSVTTRLAEQMIRTCELQRESMDRTLKALAELRKEADLMNVKWFRAVATSAVRDSNNRKSFLREAKAVLGFPVRLLSGDDEAKTIFEGVSADSVWGGKDLMAFDVGGGSAEWIQGRLGQVEREISMPLGCVRLRERFVPAYPMDAKQQQALLDGVRNQVEQGLEGFELGERILAGTGGTISCLAAIWKKLDDFEPDVIHHTILTVPQLKEMWGSLNGLTLERLKEVPGLPSKRADLIIPGLSVVLATMDILKADKLHVSLRGLRYGVLERALREEMNKLDQGSVDAADESE